ncbi:MAG: flagellar hook-length control protein FliK [Sulfuricella sp.]|nr:flagellar hook-length control protein FliK [Sulfuricella sp.]
MIHNDVLNQLQLLVKTTAPPLVEVAASPAELPQWTPGEKLPAHVLASLPNGRFQVSVGEQVLDMNLPKNTQPGENIELVFVANQPRLTFILSRETQSSAKAAAATAAALTASGDSSVQAAPDSPRPPVTLSDTARFLGTLLQKVSEKQGGPETQSLVKAEPLVQTPPGDSKVFAQMLRGALSQSGLFYESHQAQWVAGERSLNELLKEPQGKLSHVGIDEAKVPNQPDVAMGAAQATRGDAGVEPPVKAQVMVALQADASPAKAADMVHPDTMPLIQQQLNTLDTRQIIWQGPVWPGQNMEWVVEERDAREQGGSLEEIPQWQTKLRLQLPNLGTVSAALAFTRDGLRINLAASEPNTADSLKQAQGKLLNSLDAAGLHLLGVTVERNEHA